MTAAREVVQGVGLLDRTWGCNVYIVSGPPATVIDAGFPVDAARIIRCLRGCEAAPARVVATHYHIDHAGSIPRIKEFFGARASAHVLDAGVIEGSEPYARFMIDRVRTAYYGALAPFILRHDCTAVEEKLQEGDVVEAMGGLHVVLLGGHTAGSIALYQPERGIIFSGDVLRNEKGVLEGPPPQFSPYVEEAFYNTREKLLELDFDVLLPGHGEPVTHDARNAVRRMMKGKGRLG